MDREIVCFSGQVWALQVESLVVILPWEEKLGVVVVFSLVDAKLVARVS